MVRVKCKGCGQVLVDTEKGIDMIVYEGELEFDEEWKMKYEDRKYVVCMNCGHKVEVEKLRKVIGDVLEEEEKNKSGL